MKPPVVSFTPRCFYCHMSHLLWRYLRGVYAVSIYQFITKKKVTLPQKTPTQCLILYAKFSWTTTDNLTSHPYPFFTQFCSSFNDHLEGVYISLFPLFLFAFVTFSLFFHFTINVQSSGKKGEKNAPPSPLTSHKELLPCVPIIPVSLTDER